MGKFCLYSDICTDAPCICLQMNKYSYLADFIIDKKGNKGLQRYSVPLLVECLRRNEDIDANAKFAIHEEKCINCMFCVFGCIGNRILINNNLHPKIFCYDISQSEFNDLKENFHKFLFTGDFVKLPSVPLSHLRVKYKRFEDFTSVDETANIAVWTANVMKYLSTSLEPRVALEVGVKIKKRDRAGRLDVSLLNLKDNYLFVAETKVSFDKMMSEGRYESQMIAYETELESVNDLSIKKAKFLVIGGNESDLLPELSEKCTSKTRAGLFYRVLNENNLFFFSANALLALGIKKMFGSIEKYSLESLYDIINSKEYVGLLSCGLIKANGEIVNL